MTYANPPIKTKKPQPFVQAKLSIGQPGDKYEQEADAVADQVMRMPQSENPIQRKCEDCEEEALQMKPLAASITPIIQRQGEEEEEALQMKPMEEEEEMLQAKSDGGNPTASPELSTQLNQSKGGGSSLPDATNQHMSNAFGTDFSGVRIHTDSKAVQMNRSLGARAFTHGSDVYFNKGEYSPNSGTGKHLLAHELTHVVQQKSGEKIQRACSCPSVSGAVAPTSTIETYLSSRFPNLKSGDYCITGGETPDYNCHAYAAGNSSDFRKGSDIDRNWGNNDGNVTFADFDAYYNTEAGLSPAEDFCPADTKAVLFVKNSEIKHSAKIVNTSCGEMAESKLGRKWRIIHELYQLEGGPYGEVARYYH